MLDVKRSPSDLLKVLTCPNTNLSTYSIPPPTVIWLTLSACAVQRGWRVDIDIGPSDARWSDIMSLSGPGRSWYYRGVKFPLWLPNVRRGCCWPWAGTPGTGAGSALLAPATTQHHRQSAARRHPVVICGDRWWSHHPAWVVGYHLLDI